MIELSHFNFALASTLWPILTRAQPDAMRATAAVIVVAVCLATALDPMAVTTTGPVIGLVGESTIQWLGV